MDPRNIAYEVCASGGTYVMWSKLDEQLPSHIELERSEQPNASKTIYIGPDRSK